MTFTRPLVGVDTETTGTMPGYDRIVQIALVRRNLDGTVDRFKSLVNPGKPIDPESIAIHGITDEIARDAPSWASVGETVWEFMRGADVTGYHVHFDLDMIEAEHKRENIPPFVKHAVLDAHRFWQILEPRKLADAYERWTGKKLEGAHDALVDVEAAMETLDGQLASVEWRDSDLPGATPDELHDALWPWPKGALDPEGKIIWRDGAARWAFGKYVGRTLLSTPRDYFQWILKKDFSLEVQRIAEAATRGRYPEGPRVR